MRLILDYVREYATECFGIYLSLIHVSKATELLSYVFFSNRRNYVFRPVTTDTTWIMIHSCLLILKSILDETPKLLADTGFVDETIKAVLAGISHDKV